MATKAEDELTGAVASQEPGRDDVRVALAETLWRDGQGIADVLQQWRSAAAGIGAPVAVSRNDGVVRGIFETIDESGRLIVRADDQSLIAITAGDVHFGATASLAS